MFLKNLNKLGQFSLHDRKLLFEAILLLPVIHIALFILGYYRLHGMVEKLIPIKRSSTHLSEANIFQQAREIAQVVSIAAKHGFFKATCLRKSILVWSFLRRHDIHSSICFGVRMIDGQLEAHAWVERNGVVVNDSASIHENYQALRDVLPPTLSGL